MKRLAPVLTAVSLLMLSGCGIGRPHETPSANPNVPASWVTTTYAGFDISTPPDWKVVNQESSPTCLNNGPSVSSLQLGVANDLVCTASIQQDWYEYTHVTISKVSTPPVLTTLVGMTASNEPVAGHPAQRTHGPSADPEEESVYIPDFNLLVTLSTPKPLETGEQVLQTLRRS